MRLKFKLISRNQNDAADERFQVTSVFNGQSESKLQQCGQEFRARFLIQIGVPMKPKACRIRFSRKRW
jgi:hypothetical protein